MKAKLFALFVALSVLTPSFAEENPNLDDPKVRDHILAEAIDEHSLQSRGKKGEELAYAPNDQTSYTGWAKVMLDNRQLKGKGLSQYKDGRQYGLWTYWNENGQKVQQINYKDGKMDGLNTKWHENGQKLVETNYKDGKRDGLQTGWDKNGRKGEIYWKDGERTTKPLTGEQLSLVELMLLVKRMKEVQKSMEEAKKNNDPVAKMKSSMEFLKIIASLKKLKEEQAEAKRTPASSDPPTSPSIDFDDPETLKGIVAKAEVYNGKPPSDYTGWIKQMHGNGKLHRLLLFKNGVPNGSGIQWNENGKKEQERSYRNGVQDGLSTGWHKNGQKKVEVPYKDGKREGFGTTWYQNGNKQSEGNFKDGKEDGLWILWHENGKKMAKSYFKDGTEKSRQTYKDGDPIED